MNRRLVAYFSCSGLTERLAKKLSSVVGGDLYRIEPAVPYSDGDLDWHNSSSRSSVEMQDKASRPEITGTLTNMDDYDVVYLGFPIWWYVAPTIINTFLESCDFSGKTVIPFATSGGSGVGETDKWLHSSCSKETKWRPAKRFSASADSAALSAWVEGLGI